MTLLDLFLYYLYTGATVFGGPLAIIHTIREDLVHKKKWITAEDFENYFGYTQLAPGTISFQFGLYHGYFAYGFWGAFLCGFGLIFPSFLVMLGFSVFYKAYSTTDFLQYMLYGLAPAIIAIILHSGIKLSRNLIKKDFFLLFLFLLSIILTTIFKVQIIYQIFPAAFVSVLYYSLKNSSNEKNKNKINFLAIFSFASLGKLFAKVSGVITAAILFIDNKLLDLALVFLKTSTLTYGSGFVIVGVLQQDVVEKYHWLNMHDFLAGISFGNITPGPVVITSTFIGYMTSGFLGAIISTACIFIPTFIIVLILANIVRKYKESFYLKSFIKGANAAALGAIMSTAYNLSDAALIDKTTVIIFVVTLLIMFRYKINTLIIIGAAAACGFAVKMMG